MRTSEIAPEVRSAAQRWVLRLQSHQCDPRERAEFERWRSADRAHDAAWRAVEDVWQRSAALVDDPGVDHILRQARHRAPEPAPSRRKGAIVLAAAACLVLALGLVRHFGGQAGEAPPIVYATALGEQRTVVLDDGSTVVLDTASELQVRYDERERRLRLLRGQADFQVRHDAGRSFVVHVGDGSVTATGTRFQVRVGHDVDIVTLLQGSVVVAVDGANAAARAALRAGERIAIHGGGRLGKPERLPETELTGARGWTEGMLVVREWPLSRLVQEMNRYAATPIRLADPELATLPMSGSFRADDQQSFLLSLEYSAPVRVDHTVPGEIVVRRR